jgi:hypothetical protein
MARCKCATHRAAESASYDIDVSIERAGPCRAVVLDTMQSDVLDKMQSDVIIARLVQICPNTGHGALQVRDASCCRISEL